MREYFEMGAYWLSLLLVVAVLIVGIVAILAGIVWAGDWILTAAGMA